MVSSVTTTSNTPDGKGKGPGSRAVTCDSGRTRKANGTGAPTSTDTASVAPAAAPKTAGDVAVARAQVEKAGTGRDQIQRLPDPVVQPDHGTVRPVAPVPGISPGPLPRRLLPGRGWRGAQGVDRTHWSPLED